MLLHAIRSSLNLAEAAILNYFFLISRPFALSKFRALAVLERYIVRW